MSSGEAMAKSRRCSLVIEKLWLKPVSTGQTYYDELKRNAKFSQEMASAQDYPLIMAKKTLIRSVRQGSPQYSLAFLERRQRDRYSPKIIQEHTGEMLVGYQKIEAAAANAKTPDEARKLADVEAG